jgi:hypothetical protein
MAVTRMAAPLALLIVASAMPTTGATTLAGTWRLDTDRSVVTDGAGLFGLIGAGAPPVLHITQPANGTLVVESPINEGHARLYAPRGKTTTPTAGGTITMAAVWSGSTLTAEGTVEATTGTSARARPVTETYTLSPDGSMLTIAVTVDEGSAAVKSRFVYTRIDNMGPCETWPTPCKRAP